MAMFTAKHKNGQEQGDVPTLISKGCVVEGYVRATVLVRIDGNVKGDIFTEGLIIGENGFIEGNIETKEIIVFGTIRGNIKADSIEIKSSGKIHGEIYTNNLQIEKGAVYNGVLSMEPIKQLIPQKSIPKESVQEFGNYSESRGNLVSGQSNNFTGMS
jgi:cytoskeletal protein CcmA (bactofilin family)